MFRSLGLNILVVEMPFLTPFLNLLCCSLRTCCLSLLEQVPQLLYPSAVTFPLGVSRNRRTVTFGEVQLLNGQKLEKPVSPLPQTCHGDPAQVLPPWFGSFFCVYCSAITFCGILSLCIRLCFSSGTFRIGICNFSFFILFGNILIFL